MGQAQETEGERDPGCQTLCLSEPLPCLLAPWDSEPGSWGEAEVEEGGGAAAFQASSSLLAPSFWHRCFTGSYTAVWVPSGHPALIGAGQLRGTRSLSAGPRGGDSSLLRRRKGRSESGG